MIKLSNFKNLIPQDTRSIELCSAFSLIAISLWLTFTKSLPVEYLELDPISFWTFIAFIIGSSQLIGLWKYPLQEPIRISISWCAGTFWIWIALHTGGINIPGDIASLFIGVSNLLAFVINTAIISKLWKN
jgi:hypothetical protein